MTRVEEVKKMEMKRASLKEDYVKLQKDVRALRKKSVRSKNKENWLQAEVRFLRRRYKMLTEKNHKETTDPLVFLETGTRVHSVYRRPKKPTEVLAIEDEPTRRELTGLHALSLMSSDNCTSPEMTGPHPSPMRIMPSVAVPHGSFVTPVNELANRKGDLEKNGFVRAEKPSKVKNGQNRKIKTDLLISPEYSAKSITISRGPNRPIEEYSAKSITISRGPNRPIEEYSAKSITISREPNRPIKALAIEDKSTRHELTEMRMLSSTSDCSLPEMSGLQPSPVRIMPRFKVPQGSFFTPAVVDGQNEKVKADPLVSPESSAKIISISRRPKGPTELLPIEDQSARHELIGMQPLLSTNACAAPKMTGLHPSGMQTMPGFKVHHSTLITPDVEPANKRRRLANNGVTGTQKPPKVKDGRNRKVKADPSVPEFAAKNIYISTIPKELTEALAIEDEPARYELTGMQPSLSTDNCTLPVMPGLQPSCLDWTTAIRGSIVPPGSFVTRVEPTNKKRPLEDNGVVGAQKPSYVKDSWNKKIKAAPVLSLECGVETTNSRKPKESTEGLPIEYKSARHELTGLQLFSSSNACTSPEMTGFLPSATGMMPPFTVPQGLLATTAVNTTIKKRQNNGLVNAQKPSEVKGRQRKKTKGNPQKAISLIEEKGAGSFWDN